MSDKAAACPKCGAPLEKSKGFKSTSQSKPTEPKKSSSLRRVIITILVLALAAIGLMMIMNNPNAIPGIKVEINTPKPVVVTSRSDNGKSGLLKLRTTVYATVQNQGGPGQVLITFYVNQAGNHYDRTKSVYMSANEYLDMDVTFDEVKMLDGDLTYNVEAKAQ